jgi:hypothetical protein
MSPTPRSLRPWAKCGRHDVQQLVAAAMRPGGSRDRWHHGFRGSKSIAKPRRGSQRLRGRARQLSTASTSPAKTLRLRAQFSAAAADVSYAWRAIMRTLVVEA